MLQEIDLRALSELQGAERAFVSLYCSGPDGLAELERRERRVRTLLDEQPAEREHFDANMGLLRGAIEAAPVGSGPFCGFAGFAADLARVHPLPVAVPDLLRVGASPYLRPLAELQDEHEDFLVVAADNKATRIIQVTSAVAQAADRIKGDVKNSVKVGGWSQQRYARRREKQLLHYAKEVAEVLEGLCREREFSRIVLLGSPETTREIESVLSPALAAKLAGSKSVDLHAGDNSLMEEARAIALEQERAGEAKLWDRVRDAYLGGGLAVAGPEDVLKAALVGRVEAMIVTRDATLRGERCRDCQNVAAAAHGSCPACGSGSVFGIDLVDELVRQLELTSATTEFADPMPGLSELGDVAALVRY
jgi:hypothetical protein